ncbi:hypothetical protein [Salipiger abyssi]|uniref:Phage protein n=1 Tax=Salipiger abyssi TaxID=1250539 RepID=A0A1P8UUR3_9RHOB|nr:hypothetical protein [Salipiger abyssi]APZ53133.1 Phage protein [Salipiger abyssi]
MIDPQVFGAELAGIVKGAVAPLLARIDAQAKQIEALERAAEAHREPQDGKDGRDGADADPEQVAALVAEKMAPQLEAMQAAIDAISEAPELPDIPGMISDAVAKAVAEIPSPKDGKDGTSVTPEDVMPALEKRVDEHLASIPAPKDGRDGIDGKDGAPGERGEKGEPGADGVGMAGALIDRNGELHLTMTDGKALALGAVVGKDGAPGRDGADGLGFEDLEFIADEQGRPLAKFQRGDVVKTFRLPCIIDRGPYKAAGSYQKGDAVSFGGSLWIAQGDTAERPESGAGWRLAVKKGRDGRSAEKVKVGDA